MRRDLLREPVKSLSRRVQGRRIWICGIGGDSCILFVNFAAFVFVPSSFRPDGHGTPEPAVDPWPAAALGGPINLPDDVQTLGA
jgi:hypothetical protein